jgi:FMN-dependent NADH-azoreductase
MPSAPVCEPWPTGLMPAVSEGLLKGKKLFIASARGGFYTGNSPTSFLDHQETYLKGVLGFIGLTDVTVIRAEGIDLG